MEGSNTKCLLASVLVALSIVSAGALAYYGGRPDVNVNVNAAGGQGGSGGVGGEGGTGGTGGLGGSTGSGEPTFGSAEGDTTVFTALRTTEDLDVGRNLAITGTTTFSGGIVGVPKSIATSMSSSATTTACSLQNLTAGTRTVVAANVVDTGTAASTGSVNWIAGTSTSPAAFPAANARLIGANVTRVSGVDVITTTSTAPAVYYQWRRGEYLNFVSGTSVNAGTCNVSYF
jgi:hypothetical protein